MSCECPPCGPIQPCPIESYGQAFPSLVGPTGPAGGSFIVVENMAALRLVATPLLTNGFIAFADGHTSVNDGGGGWFEYVAASAVADNNGTIVRPSSGVGRWYRSYSGAVSVKWFGAKGDNLANDTVAILAALAFVNSLNGGCLLFPLGTYLVAWPNAPVAYGSLFNLSSNTVVMGDGATIHCPAITGAGLFYGLFGFDRAQYPVSNVQFVGLGYSQTTPGGGQESVSAIQAATLLDGAANSITKVKIDRCDFVGFGSAIYILQRRTTGVTTRQVSDVKITNCSGLGNTSGITADGKNISIDTVSFQGDEAAPSGYADALSIHSGINIKCVNYDFSGYGGQCINIRNSSENHCGTDGVVIGTGLIHDNHINCENIQIAIQAGETVYGTKNVSVVGAIINGGGAAVIITPGAGATGGTPFLQFTIQGIIATGCDSGIYVASNTTFTLTGLNISHNSVRMLSGAAGAGLYVKSAQLSVFNGNNIYTLSVGGAYVSVYFEIVYNSSISGNSFYATTAYANTIEFKDCEGITWTGNQLHGKFVISTSTTQPSTNTWSGNSCDTNGVVYSRRAMNDFTMSGGVVVQLGGAGTVVPVAGTWVVGDKVMYNPTASGAYIGGVCTVAGTPGTWKEWGLIT